MSILPQAFMHPVKQLINQIMNQSIPGSCLLCASDCGTGLICRNCEADLPLSSIAHCPQCGEQTTHGERCGACLIEAPHFDRTIALYSYEFPIDKIIRSFKYGHQLAVANWIGQRLSLRIDAPIDVIVPLPLHPERLRERGFNQSVEIAAVIGKCLNLPVHRSTLKRSRATPHQTGLLPKERKKNVRGAFECNADYSNKTILLLDDVMTTGATLNECARVLKQHGATSVIAAVAARAQKH